MNHGIDRSAIFKADDIVPRPRSRPVGRQLLHFVQRAALHLGHDVFLPSVRAVFKSEIAENRYPRRRTGREWFRVEAERVGPARRVGPDLVVDPATK